MHINQFSFAGGQIDRNLIGRRDLAKYYSSAFNIENFIVKRNGVLQKRLGFESLVEPFDSYISRVIGMFSANNPCYLLFQTDMGGRIIVVSYDWQTLATIEGTGYNTEDIVKSLEYVQSGDTIFLASRDVPPKRLVRDGDTFRLETIVFDSLDSAHKPVLTVDTTNWTKADASKTRTIYYRASELVGGKEVRASDPVAVSVPFPPAQGSFSKIHITRTDTDENFEGYNIYRNDGSGWGYIGTTTNADWDEQQEQEQTPASLTFGDWAADGASAWKASASYAGVSGEKRRPTRLVVNLYPEGASGETPFSAEIKVTMGGRTYTELREVPGRAPAFVLDVFFAEAAEGDIDVSVRIVNGYESVRKPATAVLYYNVAEGEVSGRDTFTDDYIQLDYSQSIPEYRQPFGKPGDYPGCVCLYQQRMVWASTYNNPSMFWMSVPGDLNNFSVHKNIQDDDAINASLPLTRGPRILHMVAHKALLMFCENSECVVQARGDGALSYKTVSSEQQSYTGSSERVRPLLCGNAVLFVDRAGSSVREYKYDYTLDAMRGKDISVLNAEALAEHGGIVDWCYQMFPESIVWCVMGDGTLATLTYLPEQEVYAWASMRLALDGKAHFIATADHLRFTDTSDVALIASTPQSDGYYLMFNGAAAGAFDLFGRWMDNFGAVVDTVIPDSGGNLEPLRKRIISAKVRGVDIGGVKIQALDEDGFVIDADVPSDEGRLLSVMFADAQVMGDWCRDPSLRIIDESSRNTQIQNLTVSLEAAREP